MKKIILSILLLIVFNSASAQEQKDSSEIKIDTINVRGYVFDQFDKPWAGLKVEAGQCKTTTSVDGYFELKGIKNKSHIIFTSDTLGEILFNNTSRFIKHRLVHPVTRIGQYNSNLNIEAKRKNPQPALTTKSIEFSGFPNYDNFATYPGGLGRFYRYIQDNLKYPESAIEKNLEGSVAIEFDITKSGSTNNFKVMKDIGYGCSEALIDLVKKSKKWNPAMHNGRPTIKRFYLEVPFKLID